MNAQESVVYSVYAGIDWADKKHDVCICPRDSDTREFDIIRHCAEAIDTWVKDLHRRFGGRIAIAIELSKGPIVSALQKYGSNVSIWGRLVISCTWYLRMSLFT